MERRKNDPVFPSIAKQINLQNLSHFFMLFHDGTVKAAELLIFDKDATKYCCNLYSSSLTSSTESINTRLVRVGVDTINLHIFQTWIAAVEFCCLEKGRNIFAKLLKD